MTVIPIVEHIDSPKSKPSARAELPQIFSAKTLGEMVFPPVQWTVPGILPQGLTLLAGRPKLGKSWLALDVALAVARGGYCLGDRRCPSGDVLYLALEDNQRRLQERVEKITVPGAAERWPERLDFATLWPRANAGGIAAIRRWAASKAAPRLVIVDVLAEWRPVRSAQDSPYDSDYRAIKDLQALAGELGISALMVHHVRKSQGEGDQFEKISGTLGLSGAADACLILDRDSTGCTLYGRGRDMAEFDLAISFSADNCRWTIQGEAADVRRTDERGAILAALREQGEPMSPADIAAATGTARNNTKQLLFKMARAGEVRKAGRGGYSHPDAPISEGDNP